MVALVLDTSFTALLLVGVSFTVVDAVGLELEAAFVVVALVGDRVDVLATEPLLNTSFTAVLLVDVPFAVVEVTRPEADTAPVPAVAAHCLIGSSRTSLDASDVTGARVDTSSTGSFVVLGTRFTAMLLLGVPSTHSGSSTFITEILVERSSERLAFVAASVRSSVGFRGTELVLDTPFTGVLLVGVPFTMVEEASLQTEALVGTPISGDNLAESSKVLIGVLELATSVLVLDALFTVELLLDAPFALVAAPVGFARDECPSAPQISVARWSSSTARNHLWKGHSRYRSLLEQKIDYCG